MKKVPPLLFSFNYRATMTKTKWRFYAVEEACYMLWPGDRMSQCSRMNNVEQRKAPRFAQKVNNSMDV